MPQINFVGNEQDEQAVGAELNSQAMKVFAVVQNKPTQMHFLGGHEIPDAPDYEVDDAKVISKRKFKDGLNYTEDQEIVPETIKKLTWTIDQPSRAVTVTDRLFQQQRNCKMALAAIPTDCVDECDKFVWVGADLRFRPSRLNSGLQTYGADDSAILKQQTATTTGDLLKYYGMEASTFYTGANETIEKILIVDEYCGNGDCGCPYQKIIIAGKGSTDPFVKVSLDGGSTWTAMTITAVTADLGVGGGSITDMVYHNGTLIVAYSDVVAGTGTVGGIAISTDLANLALANIDEGFTQEGIQTLTVARGNVYAFGTAGGALVSCNGGSTWTEITTGITEDILDSDYDPDTQSIFLACSGAKAYQYTFKTFVDISSAVSPTAATDLTAVAVVAPGSVMFGGGDGNLYENTDVRRSTTWSVAVFSAAIHTIVGDGLNMRVLIGTGNNVYIRELLTYQEWTLKSAVGAAVKDIVFGKPLPGEGPNYTLVGSVAKIVEIAACNICLEGNCA